MTDLEEHLAPKFKDMCAKSEYLQWLKDHYDETPLRNGDQFWYLLSDEQKKKYLDAELDFHNSKK